MVIHSLSFGSGLWDMFVLPASQCQAGAEQERNLMLFCLLQTSSLIHPSIWSVFPKLSQQPRHNLPNYPFKVDTECEKPKPKAPN